MNRWLVALALVVIAVPLFADIVVPVPQPSVPITVSPQPQLVARTNPDGTITEIPVAKARDAFTFTWNLSSGPCSVDWSITNTDQGSLKTVNGTGPSASYQFTSGGEYTLLFSQYPDTPCNGSGGARANLSDYVLRVYDPPALTFLSLTPNNPPIAGIEEALQIGPGAFPADFLNISWDFGDGHTTNSDCGLTSAPGPTFCNTTLHTWSNPGTYQLKVTVSNPAGTKSMNMTLAVPPDLPRVTWQMNGTPVAATPIQFTSTIGGSATGRTILWDFDDGSTSTNPNPTHTFAAADDYNVSLTVTNVYGSAHSTISISAAPALGGSPPVAAFDFTPAIPVAGQPIAFADHSTGSPVRWRWDFGDSTSTVYTQNPSHTFAAAGRDNVSLWASNAYGKSNSTKFVNVFAGGTPPVANFSWTPLKPVVGQTVQFTDLSAGAASWKWDFGDGGSSTLENPTHVFASAGNQPVTLRVTNAFGSNSITIALPCDNATVTGLAVNFTWAPTSPLPGQQVQFTDLSSGAPDSWSWVMSDGFTSTVQNPVHAFVSAGQYAVNLRVDKGQVTQQLVQIVNVGSSQKPVAAFDWSPGTPAPNQPVTFFNASNNALSYVWSFGDGGGSTAAAPVHTYAQEGTYAVTLTATNSFGFDTIAHNVVVTAQEAPPQASFFATPNPAAAGTLVRFTDTSSGKPSTWLWEFNDGNRATSSAQNPAYTFANDATYLVHLTVTNAKGQSSVTVPVVITKPPDKPVANFTWAPPTPAVNEQATFTDQSTNTPKDWQWTFGDGATASGATATHAYAATGQYDVTLTVLNDAGTDTKTQTVTVVSSDLTANFTIAPDQLLQDQPVTFTDISTGRPDSVEWKFSDGETDTGPFVTRTFTKGGDYSVELTATRNDGATSFRSRGFTVLARPVASFTTSPVPAIAGTPVTFVDTSSGSPTNWRWTLNGAVADQTRSFTNTFSAAGPVEVTLGIANAAGADSVTRIIEVKPKPSSERPYVNSLKGYGPCVFQSPLFRGTYDASVDWRSLQPSTVDFTIGQGAPRSVPADALGASVSIDGTMFARAPGVTDNVLSAKAVAANGDASDPVALHLYALDIPLAESKVTSQKSGLSIANVFAIPPAPLEVTFTPPDQVPVFGGYPIGMKDVQIKFEEAYSTSCSYSSTISGGGGVTAAGVTGGIEVSGNISRPVSKIDGISPDATASVGLEGSVRFSTKPIPIVQFMPAIAPICGIPLVGRACSILTVTSEGGGAAGGQLNFKLDKNYNPTYTDATMTGKFLAQITGGAEVKPAKIEVFGGASAGLTGSFTRPFFREAKATIEAGARVTVYSYAFEPKLTVTCTYDASGGGCGSPLGKAALTYPMHAAAVAASPAEVPGSGDPVIVGNLGSLATSTTATRSDRTLTVYLGENPAAGDSPQRLDLRYVTRSGNANWSASKSITNDLTGDFDPALVFAASGRAVLAWERLKTNTLTNADLGTASDLPKLFAQTEIAAATYDPNADSWSTPEMLTSNDLFDHSPALASLDDGRVLLAWIREASDGASDQQIIARNLQNGSWSAEQVIASGLRGIDALSLASHANDAQLVFSHDKDGNADTASDREIALLTFHGGAWSSMSDLTSDNVADVSPSVAFGSDGNARVVWLRDGDIVTKSLPAGPVEVVRDHAAADGGVANPIVTSAAGGADLVTWTDRGDLFARRRASGSAPWSHDIRLTETPENESRLDTSFDADGTLHLIGIRSTADAGSTLDLVDIKRPFRVDLAAVPRSMTASNPAPADGASITLEADVRNDGDLPVHDVAVALVSGRAGVTLAATAVNGDWLPGETKHVTLQTTASASTPLLTIIVDPQNETGDANLANNAVSWSFANHQLRACMQASAVTGAAPLSVTFDAACSSDDAGSITAESWAFSDGSVASGSRVTHAFTNSGSYGVTLTVQDDLGGTSSAQVTVVAGDGAPDLRKPADPAAALYIPVVGRANGVAGSFFLSDVTLLNTDSRADLTVSAAYLPDGRSDVFTRTITLRGGEMLTASDIVATAFSAPNGSGALRLDLSRPHAIALARTYNSQPSGTAGFSNTAVPRDAALGAGDTGVILQHWLPGYRTNLGFVEVSGVAATITVTAFDATGANLGSKAYTLAPYAHTQINGEALFQNRGRLEITVAGGRVIPYVSTIDGGTGDAIYQEPLRAKSATAATLLIPVAARLAGVNNTTWRTDVRIYNPTPSTQTVTVELHTASATATKTADIRAGQTLAYDDVLAVLFPQFTGNVSGALVITAPSTILASSRTFNLTSGGTYGLYVPARTPAELLSEGDTAHLIALQENTTFRCNLGMTSFGGGASIHVRAFDTNGVTLAAKDYSVGDSQNAQINGFLRDMGVPTPIDAAGVEITVTSGSVLVYASLNDNRTGDGTFIEATRGN